MDIMRHVLAVALLAAIGCGGCEKQPEGPQTTDMGPPEATAGPLRPLEPPAGDVPSAEYGATAPGPVIREIPANSAVFAPPDPMPVPAPAPVPEPARPRMHTIQRGDTFIKIARSIYGEDRRWKDIAAANPGLNPNKLQVGQTIVLPE